jgi:hypothetical protein
VSVVLRGLEQLADLGREQVVLALLIMEKVTEASFRKAESVPWGDVEIADTAA